LEFKLLLQRCTEELGHGLGLHGILLRLQVRELAQRQRRIVAVDAFVACLDELGSKVADHGAERS